MSLTITRHNSALPPDPFARPAQLRTTLTPSEQRIADMVIAGHSNKEIAHHLHTSVAAVEAHLSRAYRKLGVHSRTKLTVTLAGSEPWSGNTDPEPHMRQAPNASMLPDALTPAEERVAHHVAAGLANKQIAAKLGVSQTTVETHLLHIYRKLSLRSRTQLARLATETA
jgi:DNA-binding NarL/FixJ family response regulator